MTLRDYQSDIFSKLIEGDTNDLVQLDTGAGKTPIEAALANHFPLCIAIAHRNILIAQISEKMAAANLFHDTISTEHTRRRCQAVHRRRHGRDNIKRGHKTRLVASIDSLIIRAEHGLLDIDTQLPWVLVIDEAHHVVAENKWGKLRSIFPNARIIGFTATPCRFDGEILSLKNGGLFEKLVQADNLREESVATLIHRGYLSGYIMYAAPYRPTLSDDEIFNAVAGGRTAMAVAADPCETYMSNMSGLQCLAIMPSIRNAQELREELKKRGVAAAVVHSDLGSADISRALDDFESRTAQVLCAVEMVSEGFDVPGIESILLCNYTGSFGRYRQWIGRALRPAAGKKRAVIYDLCGNVIEHGLPDDHVAWNIDKPPKGGRLRSAPCIKCWHVYPVKTTECPECGTPNELHKRSQIGGHYVNLLTRVDTSLIEHGRREATERDLRRRRETEINWPYFAEGGDLISRTVSALRRWFVCNLQSSGIPPITINEFLDSRQARENGWWINNFSASDLNSDNYEKCMKVLRKWKKSS